MNNQRVYHTPYCPKPSPWPWIIAIIILLLVAIGLGIWLAVVYTRDRNSNNGRTLNITGAKITAGGSSVTGSWTTLENEDDKVTLYVSEEPFVFLADGTIACNQSAVKCAGDTGSNKSVTITTLTHENIYNAALIVTNDDTVNYRIYGPRKVYTQTSAEIDNGVIFNIRDLTNCTGNVTSFGTYLSLIHI